MTSSPADLYALHLTVNGVDYPLAIDPRRNLLGVLRNDIGLSGTKEGCDDCECGACIVLLDGQPVNSCSYLAAQAEGREVTTIEGITDGDELHPLQRNILEEGGVQCGFCTPACCCQRTHSSIGRPRRAMKTSASACRETCAGAPATQRSLPP